MAVLLAYAVIREDPPVVYAAEDLDVLHRVLALKVVAQTAPSRFPPGVGDRVREALLDERWGDAVVGWIDATGTAVDVYSDLEVWSADRLAEPDLSAVELQLTPLFASD